MVSDSSLPCCSPGEDRQHMSNSIFSYEEYQRLTSRLKALPPPLIPKYLTALRRGSIQHTPCHRHTFVSWAWDVSALRGTPSGLHTCRGLCRAAEQDQQGLGAARPWSQALARTKPQRTALRQEKQPPFGWCLYLGGFCWRGSPKLCRRCAELSVQVQRGTRAGKQRHSLWEQRHCLG